MSRSVRSLAALLAVLLLAAALVPVAVARPKDPHGGRGGHGDGRPDPRCRSVEHRLDGAREGVGQAQITLRQASRKVAAKQRAVRAASGRSAKARAQRQLRAAKRAQRAARGDVRSAKARVEAAERQARAFDCDV